MPFHKGQGHNWMTEIYVDADACPVKDETVRVAERHGEEEREHPVEDVVNQREAPQELQRSPRRAARGADDDGHRFPILGDGLLAQVQRVDATRQGTAHPARREPTTGQDARA